MMPWLVLLCGIDARQGRNSISAPIRLANAALAASASHSGKTKGECIAPSQLTSIHVLGARYFAPLLYFGWFNHGFLRDCWCGSRRHQIPTAYFWWNKGIGVGIRSNPSQ